MNAATEFDLGPLTWVKGEIDAALDRSSEALNQFRESKDVTKLKFCRTHIHQVHGALSIVGLDGVTQVTETLEGLLTALEEGNAAVSEETLAAVDRVVDAIRQYLDDLMAGEPNQPLRLLPVYRALNEARGAGKFRPSDLFFPDLSIRPPKRAEAVVRLSPDDFRACLKRERMRFQKGLLAWLRSPGSQAAADGLQQMRAALKAIEATQETPAARTFWWVSQGFLDALSDRGIAAEQEAKQLCARIDLQIRRLLEGSRNVAERLLRDALYYVGQMPEGSAGDGLAASVRASFQLENLIPKTETVQTTAPQEAALRCLREVIVVTEEFWNKFCAGSAAALSGFAEQARNCAQITLAVGHTDLKRLGQGLGTIAAWLAEQPSRQSDSVAMEVATAILLLQNAQENFKRLGTDFATQVDHMVARLQGCISGNLVSTGEEVPVLDEMTRRAQEKLLITQVAREIQSNLAQIEQALDSFFREPGQGFDAAALAAPIKQISGALTILGHDKALESLQECSEQIKRFGETGYQPSEEDFEAVAQQLSTLGFFIDGLQTGATDYEQFVRKLRGEEPVVEEKEEELAADEIQIGEPLSGEAQALNEAPRSKAGSVEEELKQKKEETKALLAALKEAPENEQIKHDLKQNLQALQTDADLVADHALGETAKAALTALESGTSAAGELDAALAATLKPAVAEAPVPTAETLKLAQGSHEEIDAELLEIFLEEAKEVIGTLASELENLRAQPHNVDTLTNIRRSSHTLKGSGRMVGLKDLGEVAWEVEQTLNMWLRQEIDVTPELMDMIALARDVFSVWVHELSENTGNVPDASALIALAGRLRGGETAAAPAKSVAAEALPPEVVAEPTPMAEVAETAGLAEEMPAEAPERVVEDLGTVEDVALQFPAEPEVEFELPLEPAGAVTREEMARNESGGPDLEFDLGALETAGLEVVELPVPTPSEPAPQASVALELPDSGLEPEVQPLESRVETKAPELDFSFSLGELEPLTEGIEVSEAGEAPAVSPELAEPEPVVPEAVLETGVPSGIEPEVADETVELSAIPEMAVIPGEAVAAVEESLEVEAIELPGADETGIVAEFAEAEKPAETPAIEAVEAELAEPMAVEELEPVEAPVPGVEEAPATEQQVGETLIPQTLYDIFCEEARQHLDMLQKSYAEIEVDPKAPTTFAMTRAAHTLGGIAATVGLMPINKLAIGLEHALLRRDHSAQPDSVEGLEIVRQSILALEDMFNGLSGQIPPESQPVLLDLLENIFSIPAPAAEPGEPVAEVVEMPQETSPEPGAEEEKPAALDAQIGAVASVAARIQEAPHLKDELDEQLLPIFLEEAQDLVQGFAEQLHAWRDNVTDTEAPRALARLLHTFKGGARMAGAMNLGEMTHSLETGLEDALRTGQLSLPLLAQIESGCDTLTLIVDRLLAGEPPTLPEVPVAPVVQELVAEPVRAVEEAASVEAPVVAEAQPVAATPVAPAEPQHETVDRRALIRVRAELIDRLVNEAGELSIARARIEGEMLSLKSSLLDLTENIIRLRRQLREIEIQSETQMQARTQSSQEGKAEFDPLELDRFTRFQELTRFMAESVNDVATVQQSLLKNLDDTNAAIVSQARMTRSLQQDLMGIRMVPFASQAERLYRIVRQTSKELGKRANLDIRGGHVELDRSVLDKIMAPVEHMLRNAISHGIEDRDARLAAGKSEVGDVTLSLFQEGNEIVVAMSDDGRGLDVEKIRERAISRGMLAPDQEIDNASLYDFIFQPGFSTAKEVTQIAGRGVGMDVVKSEVANLGGRIEIISAPGKGTTFRLYLPLTLTMMQTLLVRANGKLYAVPSTMIEQVLEVKEDLLLEVSGKGRVEWKGNSYAYSFLPHLLGEKEALPESRRRYWVLLLRSGAKRVSVLVDELQGNQEVVIKNVGSQLARVVGLAGATVLGDGRVVLILNPVALASRQPLVSVQPTTFRTEAAVPVEEQQAATMPTVLVVDDSLTVRKITGRLLAREGYQVITAKDGVDALEHLVDTIPDVMISDVEMPRMDGFDLVRNVRGDERLAQLPIIMITSRTADKHRNYALEIGANEYLGKPYEEEKLLELIAGFVKQKRAS